MSDLEYWHDLSPAGRRAVALAPYRKRPRRVAKKIEQRNGHMHYGRRHCQHRTTIPGTWPEDQVCVDCGRVSVEYDLGIDIAEPQGGEPCSHCDGAGNHGRCPSCEGTGDGYAFGDTCSRCAGSVTVDDECVWCSGTGKAPW